MQLKVTNKLTHSMQQGPSSEAGSFSANLEIPTILWYSELTFRRLTSTIVVVPHR